MKVDFQHLILEAAEKVVLAIAGGLAIGMLPFLQHWLVYFLWGPCGSALFVWAYSGDKDLQSEDAKAHFGLSSGLVVGLAHLMAVTSVWLYVTKTWPPVQ